MAIKATIYKLIAPDETDKCFTRATTTTIEEAMQQMNESYEYAPHLRGLFMTFLRFPSCKAVKILDGTFKDAEDLRLFLLYVIDISPDDYQNGREWLESVLINPRNYRHDYVAQARAKWRVITSDPYPTPILWDDVLDSDDEETNSFKK